MKKTYEDPQMQIRKYSLLPADAITTSGTPTEPGKDLTDGDDKGDIFAS